MLSKLKPILLPVAASALASVMAMALPSAASADTFGETSISGTDTNVYGNYIACSYTCTVDGLVNSLVANVSTGAGQGDMALYSNINVGGIDYPYQKLTDSGAHGLAGPGWNAFDVTLTPATVQANAVYWLVFETDNSSNRLSEFSDASQPAAYYFQPWSAYPPQLYPATPTGRLAFRYSFYAIVAPFTPTPSATRTSTTTRTPTLTRTPTVALTPTMALTPTVTPTLTASLTTTATPTRTASLTTTATPTPTASPTATPTPSQSPTPSHSATYTATLTATPVFSPTITRTVTPTRTPTPTVTPVWAAALTENTLLVFPNPARGGQVALAFTAPSSGTARFLVYNSAYQLVDDFTRPVPDTGPRLETMPVDNLAPGVYLVRLTLETASGKQAFAVAKLVVLK